MLLIGLSFLFTASILFFTLRAVDFITLNPLYHFSIFVDIGRDDLRLGVTLHLAQNLKETRVDFEEHVNVPAIGAAFAGE